MKRLVSYDPFTGTQTWHEKVGDETRIHYTFTRDEAPVVDICRSLASDNALWKRGVKEEFVPYSHIPNSIMLKWHIEEGIPLFDAEEYHKKVNQREWSALKLTTKTDGAGTNDRKIYIP